MGRERPVTVTRPKRPNLLLITADQHRGDCLGIEGHPVLQTPNLDFLGASGAHFRRAYAEAPSCIPARRSLISGQSPAAHGMVGFQGGVPWEPAHTLPGELSRAGYQCEMVGKLHLYPARKRFGYHRLALADSTRGASNDYLDWLAGAARFDPPLDRWAMAHGATPNGWIGRPSHLPETQTHAFWCVSQAIELLAKRDPTAPFFLNVSFIDPHPPLTPPSFYYDRYVDQALPAPFVGDWARPAARPVSGQNPEGRETRGFVSLSAAEMRSCRAGYYGLINHVDTQVGRLIQFLRDARLLDETLILYTADHGEMLGDHHMFAKANPFEGSARVPFLLRPPASLDLPWGVAPGQPVGLQDVMPTLLDAAGVSVPESVTGRSVLPLLAGRADGWRDVLHGEHAPTYAPDDGVHYLVDDRTKYVWFSHTGREHLFDLAADPHERRDLLRAPDGAARAAPWRRRLAALLRERPEGFADGDDLIPGRPHRNLVADGAAEAGAGGAR
jgi:arylsulfatase A-like enzyme